MSALAFDPAGNPVIGCYNDETVKVVWWDGSGWIEHFIDNLPEWCGHSYPQELSLRFNPVTGYPWLCYAICEEAPSGELHGAQIGLVGGTF